MTFIAAMMILGSIGCFMCLLDFLLSKIEKDWKKMPWEDDE